MTHFLGKTHGGLPGWLFLFLTFFVRLLSKLSLTL
jgi:hypothetical protein